MLSVVQLDSIAAVRDSGVHKDMFEFDLLIGKALHRFLCYSRGYRDAWVRKLTLAIGQFSHQTRKPELEAV